MRLIQHKKEAYWFYRYLSIFYDKLVNPLFWTKRMRDEALELGQLGQPGVRVIDVGSGTGFTTEGIVRHVPAERVTCVDQSPHQMARAKKKEALRGCTFQLGDAENIPFGTDEFDRYVSAGSIEYWPNPQQGINEGYRVIKPGGIALMIGPLEPVNGIARFMANTWMLFPKEEEYLHWFREAGFQDIKMRYVKPHWVNGRGEYGIAISGVKPAAGLSPAAGRTEGAETAQEMTTGRWLQLAGRVLIGSLAGFIFIPAALFGYIRSAFGGQTDVPEEYRERLNGYQLAALVVIILIIGLVISVVV
ncbi:MAG: methyltransferase domain-containing protein [Lewinellaceae bacterium]|nr:methyltransferase domain-containing protein [Phaeodactylibacter sp.]MCB9347837.1 methyltransferase domain-containing protein [Lewinellaceae bacterium]